MNRNRERPRKKHGREDTPVFAPPSEDDLLDEYRFYLHEQLNGADDDKLMLTSGYQEFETSIYQTALDDYKEAREEYEKNKRKSRRR